MAQCRRCNVFAALALTILLAAVLRFENQMIFQVRTMLLASKGIATSWNEDAANLLSFSSSSSSSSSAASSTSIQQNHTDWFQEEAWHENRFTKECWHVEDICHSSHRWFYDPRSLNQDHQPSFSFSVYEIDSAATRISRYAKSSSASSFLGRPKKLFVPSPQSNLTLDWSSDLFMSDTVFLESCKYSPIRNHVVLQSYYNEMLGEFYTRSLAYLNKIYQSVVVTATDAQRSQDGQAGPENVERSHDKDMDSSFPEQTQIYLHVRNFPEHGKLLDSHHVFTDAFRSNALLSFTYLVDYTGCRCMKRLLLCGYDSKIGTKLQKVRGTFVDPLVTTELYPAGASGPDYIEREFPSIFRDLRQQLRGNVVQRNPFIQQDIANFRAGAIARHRPSLTDLTQEDISKFRIVGLTQRKGRRRWLNLDETLRLCNTKWFKNSDRIVCIEVNLEKDDVNPVRQVVIHAACDMLFGIHGAQLTEAVWMKDGSVVVELLPWIPDSASHGSWTRTTNVPTPLGMMFSKSALNHIGYPLKRDSAPYCLDKSDPASLKKCFASHLWDGRDFQVGTNTIRDMIQKFAPVLNSDVFATCDDLKHKAGDRVYVLYNVLCSNQTGDDTQSIPSVHHFYWPKNVTSL